jgi:hypothetical protein
MARALDLDRANAAPDSYVEVPACGPARLAASRSQPNLEQHEVMCGALLLAGQPGSTAVVMW